jgi:hypothetical protein
MKVFAFDGPVKVAPLCRKSTDAITLKVHRKPVNRLTTNFRWRIMDHI